MANWSSGMALKRLNLGHSGVLPSDPDFPVVLHGQQSLESLSRILNKDATPEDLAVAQQLAAKNKPYDTLIKEALAAGKANYGDQIKQQLENEYPRPQRATDGGRRSCCITCWYGWWSRC